MTNQTNNEEFLTISSPEAEGLRSRLDAALAAVKALESAIDVTNAYVEDLVTTPVAAPESEFGLRRRRTNIPFLHRHVAELEIAIKRKRSTYFPQTVLDDGGWNIMIDLFLQQERGREISISSACLASQLPPTTALRWLDILESEKMIVRENDPADRRRRFVRLSDQAHSAMSAYLSWVATTRYRANN